MKTRYNLLDLENISDLKLVGEIKTRVKEIETSLLTGSIICSKVQDIDTNENPTSYFFQREMSLSISKTVKSVTCNNISYTKSEDILSCFTSFYKNLYENESVDPALNNLFLDNVPKVNNADNLFLEKPIEKSEIFQVYKLCNEINPLALMVFLLPFI